MCTPRIHKMGPLWNSITCFHSLQSENNHSLAEVGMHLWRSPGPALLLKQGHLELIARDHVKTAFDCLGNLCQYLVTPTVTKCFPVLRQHLCFNLCLLVCVSMVLSLGTMDKTLALTSLHPLSRSLYTLIRCPWVFFGLNSSSSPSLSSYVRCSSPLIIFAVLHWTLWKNSISLLFSGAQNGSQNGLINAEGKNHCCDS